MYPRVDGSATYRLRNLARVAFVWGSLIFLQLLHLQVFSHSELKRQALAQQEKTVEIPAPRGKLVVQLDVGHWSLLWVS